MSTEVTDQDQPQEQAEKQPTEAATENGDSSSKPKVDGEEVKSKPDAKEEQTVAASEASEQVGTDPTTCSPLEEKIIRQIEVIYLILSFPIDYGVLLIFILFFCKCVRAICSSILETETSRGTNFCSRLLHLMMMAVRRE